jgi:hypothetical protein
MITLLHGSFEWVMAGAVVFIGLMAFIIKLRRGHYMSSVISAAIWFFVFSLHKGSTAGIMTATFAALLFDVFGMPLLKFFSRSRK